MAGDRTARTRGRVLAWAGWRSRATDSAGGRRLPATEAVSGLTADADRQPAQRTRALAEVNARLEAELIERRQAEAALAASEQRAQRQAQELALLAALVHPDDRTRH
jgi:hypothetical protein